ncbi:MAG: CoB--CoM heterodisulfide reductase iron-sulfur subunit A family protein [Deltaproteobacteria bacterium]|nr:CoB--CoM heterodisulfide reductase iron-sulfur subunit A family protein [Deltaproteobacteria bacterium]
MSGHGKRVLVLGGGIAGLYAAKVLAGHGTAVDLVEKSGFLGGHGLQYGCKAGAACEKCGACTVEQILADVAAEPRITVHLRAELAGVEGNGRFSATIRQRPRLLHDDADLAACYKKTGGQRLVVRGWSPNNRPFYAVNPGKLSEEGGAEKVLGLVEQACPGAAAVDGEEAEKTLPADAIIVATGFAPFDACKKPTYGYGKIPNVVTGLEVERGLRAEGRVLRPSDGEPPKKAAFIQCVGSRDIALGNPWCSRVCCAYALRIAQAARYKDPELSVTVFYMDIQSTGKSFPAFYEQCKKDLRFVRNIPVDAFPEQGGRVRVAWSHPKTGARVEEAFDLLVLSIGITPNPDNAGLSRALFIPLDADGFFAAGDGELERAATIRPGVFVAGTAAGPKSIPASMAHAAAAAAEALEYLKEAS